MHTMLVLVFSAKLVRNSSHICLLSINAYFSTSSEFCFTIILFICATLITCTDFLDEFVLISFCFDQLEMGNRIENKSKSTPLGRVLLEERMEGFSN